MSLSFHSKTQNFIVRKLPNTLDFLSSLGFRIVHIETDINMIIQRLKKRHDKQSRLELLSNTTGFVEIVRREKRNIEELLKILCTQIQVDIKIPQKENSKNVYSAAQQIADLFMDR